jgi:DNA-binding HxlR family transcriptional regulator
MTDHPHGRGQLMADCRLRAATDLLTHGWDPVVLAALRDGPQRRHQLRTAIGTISEKVLTQTLRRLTDAGLITAQRYAQAPPRVDYALTALGTSFLEGPMAALAAWITRHGDELLQAQEHRIPH